MSLRTIRCSTLALATLALSSNVATAQGATDFPSRPVTVVIPTAASVSGDILMRAYGEAVSKHLGQPIIVENKPGGSGALAAAYVAGVKPDGYTLLNITIPIAAVTKAIAAGIQPTLLTTIAAAKSPIAVSNLR